ncbi:hypothetical protein IV500_17130 [Paeniglutamicibacter antarcticus]|uniref:Uncharacterized protein n=1 Tax=Arthrobacter terrae TaxID=2935737 RepID=A0A931CM38_9MICC|nr:hypothetical protein [Arthrobacter terrae]MBG0741097.1 hypothetical protein [Arthrobacter terrae]
MSAEKTGTLWSLECVEVPGALIRAKLLTDTHAIALGAGVDVAEVELIIQPVLPFTINTGRTTPRAPRNSTTEQHDRTARGSPGSGTDVMDWGLEDQCSAKSR